MTAEELKAKQKQIIRKLLQETTFPSRAGEDCRSCDGAGRFLLGHAPDCPYLLAVKEAEEFLNA